MADITFNKNNIRAGDVAFTKTLQVSAATENGEVLEQLASGKVRKTVDDEAGVVGIQVATENKSADAAADEYVTVVWLGEVVGFDDLVPGQVYYLSANAGNIADAAVDGDTVALGYAPNANTLWVMPALADRPSS